MAGLLLAPCCVPVARAAARLAWQSWTTVPPVDGTAWFWGGMVFWGFLYLVLPRPVKTYVLAHELSHWIWARLSGVRAWNLRVSERGGSVTLSRTSVLISLAPYLFPLYTLLALLLRWALSFFGDPSPYQPFWMAAIGVTWGFHVTFTLSFLLEGQPDIEDHGRLFSLSLIVLMNLLFLALWISMAEGSHPPRFAALLLEEIQQAGAFLGFVWASLRTAGHRMYEARRAVTGCGPLAGALQAHALGRNHKP